MSRGKWKRKIKAAFNVQSRWHQHIRFTTPTPLQLSMKSLMALLVPYSQKLQLPQILHSSPVSPDLNVQDPERLWFKRLNSVVSFYTEAKSRSLTWTKRDEQAVKVSILALQKIHQHKINYIKLKVYK